MPFDCPSPFVVVTRLLMHLCLLLLGAFNRFILDFPFQIIVLKSVSDCSYMFPSLGKNTQQIVVKFVAHREV